jgi:hypothetical protein
MHLIIGKKLNIYSLLFFVKFNMPIIIIMIIIKLRKRKDINNIFIYTNYVI